MKLQFKVGLIILIGVIVTLVFTIPISAQAQELPSIPTMDKPISDMTISELQAKIAEIMTVIQQIQALIAQLTGGVDISGIPSLYTFNTNLSYGSSSNEVKYLQIFLNQDPDTRVSSTGPGSLGQETTFFGNKTKQAVIKFQEKYASEVLSPYNLSNGTGYVGTTTRAKMNQLLEQYRAGTIIPPGEEEEEEEEGTYCGDSIAQRPNHQGTIEDCDGLDLRTKTCIAQGYTGGILSCNNDCSFNTSQCTGPGPGGTTPIPEPTPACGDNTCNGTETCSSCPADCGQCSPTNNAPILNTIGNKTIDENNTLSFTISATDSDNDTLTYSAQNTPSGSSFNTATRTFTWTPTYEQQGTYSPIFIVSDTEYTDQETITITVNDVCTSDTCQDLGYECDTWDDGCGSTINCGTCESGYTCTNGQCIQDAPVPVCGDNECNGTETCATCPGDCGACAAGNVYYVHSVSGNDNNPGTKAQPWKTLAYALGTTSLVGPGDTVYLRGGTYREQVVVRKYGTADNWITVKSYPGETAILDGTEPVTGWTQAESDDPYLTVQGAVNSHYGDIYWTWVEASEFPSNLSSTIIFEDREMCRIASDPDQSVGFGEETLEMRDVGEGSNGQKAYLIDPTLNQEDDYWNGAIIRVFLYNYNANVAQKNVADYIKDEHKIVFDLDMPVDLRYDVSRKDRYRFVNHPHILDSAGELYISGIETVDGTDYRRIYYWPNDTDNLENKMALSSRSWGIYRIEAVASYLVIEDLTIFGIKGAGIYFQGTAKDNRGSYVTVRNCIVTDCGGTGIYYVYMNNVRVENSYVRRCNNRGIMGNVVDYCVFKNNDVGDTASTNISFYTATNSMIINNTLRGIRGGHGNGTSVYGQDGFCEDILLAGNRYYNTNMAFNNNRNLTVFGNLFRGDESDPFYAITAWSSRYDGHQVWMNNTVPIVVTYGLLLHQRNVGDVDLPHHYVVNNVFHGLCKGWDEKWNEYDPGKVVVEDRTYNAYTDYSWQQQSSGGWFLQEGEQDLLSTPLTDMFVNPTYPDGDYHLKADSPLSGAGKNVQGILADLGIIAKFPEYDFTKDLAGNPWNNTPSIGCYEY